jgi:hypothetical protein
MMSSPEFISPINVQIANYLALPQPKAFESPLQFKASQLLRRPATVVFMGKEITARTDPMTVTVGTPGFGNPILFLYVDPSATGLSGDKLATKINEAEKAFDPQEKYQVNAGDCAKNVFLNYDGVGANKGTLVHFQQMEKDSPESVKANKGLPIVQVESCKLTSVDKNTPKDPESSLPPPLPVNPPADPASEEGAGQDSLPPPQTTRIPAPQGGGIHDPQAVATAEADQNAARKKLVTDTSNGVVFVGELVGAAALITVLFLGGFLVSGIMANTKNR